MAEKPRDAWERGDMVTDQEIRLRDLCRSYMLGMGLCGAASAFLLGWVLGRYWQ